MGVLLRLVHMRDLIPYFDDLIRLLMADDPGAVLRREPAIRERNRHYGRITVAVRYSDGSTLDVRLWADCWEEWPKWITYSFHYRDAQRRQRFRFDNAAHRPEMPNFPHHLHIGPNDEQILPLGPPSVRDVADAVRWHLLHAGERWSPGTPP